jgi:hypothetical protein
VESIAHTSAASPPAVVIGADDDAAYRTVSILSIVSLVLGLTAPLALIAPLLFALPIAGAVVAVLAIRRIAVSDGALVGRTAAVIGLALSIASVSAAFTRTALIQELLSRQARAAAFEWFTLLQAGDAERAFQMTTASRQSPPPKDPADPHDAGSEPETPPLETFRVDPVVHFLLDHAQGTPVEYVRDSAFDPGSGGNVRIQQLFTVGATADSGRGSATSVEIVLQRVRGINGAPSQWLVSAYKSDDVTADSG